MATVAHINRFLSAHPGKATDAFLRWWHNHPTLTKVIEIATLLLGVGLSAAPLLTGASIAMGLVGAAFTLASAVAFFALDFIFAPPHHDMKNHVFKTGQCEGGSLAYVGDIPVLTLNSNDPFTTGKAEGYLLGQAIQDIKKRFDFALHTVARRPRAHEVPELLTRVKATIPPEYIREMEGLVAGFNQWTSEQSSPRPNPVTLEEVLYLQLIPDAHNLPMGGMVRSPFLRQAPAVACTSMIDRDRQRGMILGRNMDWLSLGVTGKYTLVKHRIDGHRETVEVTVPGLMGTMTGMNNRGLALSMNVCPAKGEPEVRGMPSLFFNRRCLELCGDLGAVRRFQEQNHPIGSYHLTVADPDEGASYHFYQDIPTRFFRGEEPLATFNNRMDREVLVDQHNTRERAEMLSCFYLDLFHQEVDREQLVQAALKLPLVNNFETTHTVVMNPASRTIQVAFDNAFSADHPLQLMQEPFTTVIRDHLVIGARTS